MTTSKIVAFSQREPELLGQTGVGASDVAALGVHVMTNTALTGGTYVVDGGQQLVPS